MLSSGICGPSFWSVKCVIIKQCGLLYLSLALSQFLCHYADQQNQYPFSFQFSVSRDDFCLSRCLIINRKVHDREKRLGQTLLIGLCFLVVPVWLIFWVHIYLTWVALSLRCLSGITSLKPASTCCYLHCPTFSVTLYKWSQFLYKVELMIVKDWKHLLFIYKTEMGRRTKLNLIALHFNAVHILCGALILTQSYISSSTTYFLNNTLKIDVKNTLTPE